MWAPTMYQEPLELWGHRGKKNSIDMNELPEVHAASNICNLMSVMSLLDSVPQPIKKKGEIEEKSQWSSWVSFNSLVI